MCLNGQRPFIAQNDGEDSSVGTAENPLMPMEVVGDINEEGLGLAIWWATDAAEEEEEADVPMEEAGAP